MAESEDACGPCARQDSSLAPSVSEALYDYFCRAFWFLGVGDLADPRVCVGHALFSGLNMLSIDMPSASAIFSGGLDLMASMYGVRMSSSQSVSTLWAVKQGVYHFDVYFLYLARALSIWRTCFRNVRTLCP